MPETSGDARTVSFKVRSPLREYCLRELSAHQPFAHPNARVSRSTALLLQTGHVQRVMHYSVTENELLNKIFDLLLGVPEEIAQVQATIHVVLCYCAACLAGIPLVVVLLRERRRCVCNARAARRASARP